MYDFYSRIEEKCIDKVESEEIGPVSVSFFAWIFGLWPFFCC